MKNFQEIEEIRRTAERLLQTGDPALQERGVELNERANTLHANLPILKDPPSTYSWMVVGLLMLIGGFGLLWYATDWQVALAVFLIAAGVDYQSRPRQLLLDDLRRLFTRPS
jgi:Na+-translocating ferredoxin:NAD+ oxidoreductase RnfD subunit